MPADRIWIGGGAGAGKSTAARALAVRHVLRRFAIDAFWYAYDRRWGRPRKSPDEQWLETPPGEQAVEFEETSRRMMGYVLDDLAALPEMPTVVEGPQILPDLVPAGEQAVFLHPTPDFQRAVLESRPMPSSDWAQALANRLVKDRLYADRVAELALARGFPVIETDFPVDMDSPRDLAVEVAKLVELPSAAADLRRARRWENEAAAANIRSWLASPESPREDGGYSFACECGRLGCGELVHMTVEEFDAARQVLAHHV